MPSRIRSPMPGVKSIPLFTVRLVVRKTAAIVDRRSILEKIGFKLVNQIPTLLLKIAGQDQITRRRRRLEVSVVVKIFRWLVVHICLAPSASGLPAVVDLDLRAVIGKIFAGPVFQETGQIFGAAAVVAIGCRNVSGDDGSVDGGIGRRPAA